MHPIFDPASSPLADAVAWLLDRLIDGELTEDQVRVRFAGDGDVSAQRGMFTALRRPIRSVDTYDEVTARFARVGVTDDKGRPMIVRVAVTDDDPVRIRRWSQALAGPPGLTVRWACPDDERALAELERQVPVQREWGSVTFDRPDSLAQGRLMGDVLHAVAELDGRLVGQQGDVIVQRWLDGAQRALLYRHHTRVLPASQGQAVMPALNGFVAEAHWRAATQPAVHLFRAMGNAKVDAAVGPVREQNVWAGVEVHKLSMPIDVLGDGHAGRPAKRADAGVIAAILDQTHAHAHLCPRFDEASVTDRLTRSPDDHDWADVLIGDDAVLGVWDEGLGLTMERAGAVERRVQATVLDWGALPGAEGSVIALLGTAAARVAESGTTHLAVFVASTHPLYGVLGGLATEIDRFKVVCAPPPPADVGIVACTSTASTSDARSTCQSTDVCPAGEVSCRCPGLPSHLPLRYDTCAVDSLDLGCWLVVSPGPARWPVVPATPPSSDAR